MNTAASVRVTGKSNIGSVISKDVLQAAASLETLQKVATGVLSGTAIAGVVRFSAEMVQLGAEVKRTTNALNTLSAGQADQYIAAIKRETNGLVSEAGAAGIATNLLGLKIVDTADEAAEFARIAAVLGGTFRGLGAEQAAEEMALLFSNMSIARLDTFGISAARVRTRIKELQDATPGLTREVAFQMAAMEEARKSADQLSGALSDQAAELERARVIWQDAKQDIGVAFSDAFGWAVVNVDKLAQSAERARVSAGRSFREMTDGAQTYQKRLEQASKAPERMAISQLQMAKATQRTTYDLEKQAAVVKAAQEAQQHLADTQRDSFSTVQALTDGWQAQSVIGQQLISDLGGMKVPAGELANLQREIAVQTGLATPEQNAQAEALDRAKLAFESGRLSAQGLLDVYLAIPQGVRAANEALGTGLEAQDKALTFAAEPKDYYDARPAIQQTEDLASALGEVGGTAESEFGRLNDSMETSMGKAQFLREEIRAIGGELERLGNVNFYGHVGVTLPGGQHGLDFTVRGPAGVDRVPVAFMATAGERVTVTPRGQQPGATTGSTEVHQYLQHVTIEVKDGRSVTSVLQEFGIGIAPL